MLMNSITKGFILWKDVEITKKLYRKQEASGIRRQINTIANGSFWTKARPFRIVRYILEEFNEEVGSSAIEIKEKRR